MPLCPYHIHTRCIYRPSVGQYLILSDMTQIIHMLQTMNYILTMHIGPSNETLDSFTVSVHNPKYKRFDYRYLDIKVHGANMGRIWGRQDSSGPMLASWTLLFGLNCAWNWQWPLKSEDNSHWTYQPTVHCCLHRIHWAYMYSYCISRLNIHEAMSPARHKPSFIRHWKSFNQWTRNMSQSNNTFACYWSPQHSPKWIYYQWDHYT